MSFEMFKSYEEDVEAPFIQNIYKSDMFSLGMCVILMCKP